MIATLLITVALAAPVHVHHRPECRNVQTMTTQWLCQRGGR